MGKSLHIKTLAASIGFALAGAVMPIHAATFDKVATSEQATSVRRPYIVSFVESGLLHYKGEANGLAATAPSSLGARKLAANSPAAVAYKAYLSTQRDTHMAAIAGALGRELTPTHSYAITMNGVGLDLTMSEARAIASLPGVSKVVRARDERVDTFRGPEFIGAPSIWDGSNVPGGTGTRGQGIVVGVIDTGGNAAHPSFANDAACGFSAGSPKLVSSADCSTSSGGVCTGTNPEANAGNGHGVHTASTAAGNTLTTSAVPPPALPTDAPFMSGVAPCANVRTYKVCATTNCAGTWILAGMENAIADGVDVINFSISGGDDPWNDGDRTFLDAVGADIFVAASAGNTRAETPDPVGQVNHLGPWVTTVAASTHNRNPAATGMLSVTGPGTPPAQLQNIVLDPGSGSDTGPAGDLPIRNYTTNNTGCTSTGGIPAGTFTGAIALISRGDCTFEEKANNAQAAGAVVAIIYNNAAGRLSPIVGSATLPTYGIPQTDGQAIASFINSSAPTAVTTTFTPGVVQGDVLGDFSLRGPSRLVTQTKPDITGPGVSIYAAMDTGTAGQYGYMSGTSMSSPHLAGAGALVRALQPSWTPSEVKSAMMLTAFTDGHKEDTTTPWDPDDVGSGRIDMTKVAKAGFVLDETFANYLAADPASSGDPKTLNVASMRNMSCTDSCDWTRTLRNTLGQPSSWTVTVNAPDGLDVSVDTPSFSFDGTLTDTQAITVTATPTTTLSDIAFAEVVFTEANGLAPDAHMYVAVKGSGNPQPDDEIFKDGFDGSSGSAGFSENWDSYTAGNNVHGQGGWKGWANDAAAGATVVTTQSVSAPNSIEIKEGSDLIHEFTGYTSGSYTITAKQYIPAAFSGKSYFIFENVYSDTDTSIISWSTQVYFDSATGTLANEDGAANPGSASYVTGQWVDIKLDVDLDNDLQTFYYNGAQLYSGSWTQQFPNQDVPGSVNIGSIDLYANGASAIYYDDIHITQNP